jgi:hypothetical protein
MPAICGHIFLGLTRTTPKSCGISLTKVTGSLNLLAQSAQSKAHHGEEFCDDISHLRNAFFYSVKKTSALHKGAANASKSSVGRDRKHYLTAGTCFASTTHRLRVALVREQDQVSKMLKGEFCVQAGEQL